MSSQPGDDAFGWPDSHSGDFMFGISRPGRTRHNHRHHRRTRPNPPAAANDRGQEAVGQALLISVIGIGALASATALGQVVVHSLNTLLVALS